jgi:glycosyltransferase involved in cell wall biosynthesis
VPRSDVGIAGQHQDLPPLEGRRPGLEHDVDATGRFEHQLDILERRPLRSNEPEPGCTTCSTGQERNPGTRGHGGELEPSVASDLDFHRLAKGIDEARPHPRAGDRHLVPVDDAPADRSAAGHDDVDDRVTGIERHEAAEASELGVEPDQVRPVDRRCEPWTRQDLHRCRKNAIGVDEPARGGLRGIRNESRTGQDFDVQRHDLVGRCDRTRIVTSPAGDRRHHTLGCSQRGLVSSPARVPQQHDAQGGDCYEKAGHHDVPRHRPRVYQPGRRAPARCPGENSRRPRRCRLPRQPTRSSASMPASPVIRVGLDYRPALLLRSGIPRAVRELSRALAQRADVDLHLFGHCLATPRHGHVPEGATLHRSRIPGRSLPLLARIGLDATRLSGDADVFHWTDYVFPPVRRSRPVVLTVHDVAFARDPSFHGPSTTDLLDRTRRAVRRANRIVCPTRATARDAVTMLGAEESRIRVVPFGIDHGAEPGPRPPLGGEPYVLMLGTIEPRKNHLRALAAWRRLGPGRPRLIVIGRPGWECRAIAGALDLAADEGVVWRRDASEVELATWLAHATTLFYPSLLEGFGFPPLEALRHGVPVCAGDDAALREVLGEAAGYCDPRDEDSMAEGLAEALDEASDTARRAARMAHASRFRWADAAAGHAAVYAEVTQ